MKKLKVYKTLQSYLRNLRITEIESIGIYRFGEDIVISDSYVQPHTDNTIYGKNTIIAVLLNEGSFEFIHDDICHILLPGDTLRFDGNKTHSLKSYGKPNSGRFAAIIWDVPIEKKTDDLRNELQDRIKELSLGIDL